MIQIWQIPISRLMEVVPTMTPEAIMRGEGYPFEAYEKVWEGEIPGLAEPTEDDVFHHFNRIEPDSGNYIDTYEAENGPLRMRSLSVGDVIVVGGRAMRCLSDGWGELPNWPHPIPA